MVNDFIVAVLYHSFLQTVLICVFDLFVHGVRARVHVNYKQKPQTDKIPNILHKIAHKKKTFHRRRHLSHKCEEKFTKGFVLS